MHLRNLLARLLLIGLAIRCAYGQGVKCGKKWPSKYVTDCTYAVAALNPDPSVLQKQLTVQTGQSISYKGLNAVYIVSKGGSCFLVTTAQGSYSRDVLAAGATLLYQQCNSEGLDGACVDTAFDGTSRVQVCFQHHHVDNGNKPTLSTFTWPHGGNPFPDTIPSTYNGRKLLVLKPISNAWTNLLVAQGGNRAMMAIGIPFSKFFLAAVLPTTEDTVNVRGETISDVISQIAQRFVGVNNYNSADFSFSGFQFSLTTFAVPGQEAFFRSAYLDQNIAQAVVRATFTGLYLSATQNVGLDVNRFRNCHLPTAIVYEVLQFASYSGSTNEFTTRLSSAPATLVGYIVLSSTAPQA